MPTWCVDSRRGKDDYPGRSRNDRKPGDVGFVDNDFANVIDQPATATTTLTSSTNLRDTSAPFTVGADVVDRYVRTVDSSVVTRIYKITARVDDQNVTVSLVHGAAPGGFPVTINAYFVGGAKKSRTTIAATGGANMYIASGDYIYVSGYETSAAKILWPSTGTYHLVGYGGAYWSANVGDYISELGTFTVVNVSGIYTLSVSSFAAWYKGGGGGGGAYNLTDCHDFGNGGLSDPISGTTFPTVTRCSAKSFKTNGGGVYSRNTFTDMPLASPAAVLDSGTQNNIFRSTGGARTTPFITHATGVADFNTFEVADFVGQPIVQVGATVYRQRANPADVDSFATYATTHAPNARLRVVGNAAHSYPATGISAGVAVEFADVTNGIRLINQASLEVGTASDGSTRGAFNPGIAFKDFNSTTGDARAWDLVSNFVISGGMLQLDPVAVIPFTAEALHPHQGHTTGTGPIISGGHRIEENPVNPGVWAWAVRAELGLSRDIQLKKIIGALSNIIAAGTNFSIFDSVTNDGAITVQIKYWTLTQWNAGGAGTGFVTRQFLATPSAAFETMSHLQIKIFGRAES